MSLLKSYQQVSKIIVVSLLNLKLIPQSSELTMCITIDRRLSLLHISTSGCILNCYISLKNNSVDNYAISER
jgi:hypothetical protein